MEGSLVPSECIRGIFSVIWGGGSGLGKPWKVLETPEELETQ